MFLIKFLKRDPFSLIFYTSISTFIRAIIQILNGLCFYIILASIFHYIKPFDNKIINVLHFLSGALLLLTYIAYKTACVMESLLLPKLISNYVCKLNNAKKQYIKATIGKVNKFIYLIAIIIALAITIYFMIIGIL